MGDIGRSNLGTEVWIMELTVKGKPGHQKVRK
jgi:hypothetical protein